MSRALLRLLRCRSGASAVEFALVAPVFLLMLFGILVYGQYLSLVHSMEQLAAQAARESLAGLDTAERTQLAENYLAQNAQFYPMIDTSRLSMSAAPATDDADVFVVTVSYDLTDTLFDLFPEFLPPHRTLSESAAIERGGY
jgi:Flp pilus assembly protein TadG